MEGFICSSEIALLIYGYLVECSEDLSKSFLQLSPHLLDYRELKDEGHDIPIEYEGLTLKQLLREYATIRYMVSKKVEELDEIEKAPLCNCNLPRKLSKLLNSNLPKISRMRSFVFNSDSVKHSTKVDNSDNTSHTTETPSMFQCSPVKDHCTNSNAVSVSSVDITAVPLQQERNFDLESIHNQGNESSSTEINVEVTDSEEKITSSPKKQVPSKLATDNQQKDSKLLENKELNESFDMSAFLKPSNNSIGVKQPTRKSTRRKEKDKTTENVNCIGKSSNIVSAELQPYPEIHYEPVDCNIMTSNISTDTNCVYYSNSTPSAMLSVNQGSNRYRNILPKYGSLTYSDIHPVVVCTPLMPSTNAAYVAPPVCEEPVAKVTRPSNPRTKKSRKEVKKLEEPKAIILPTPPHSSFEDMPNISATPQPPVPPTSQQPNPSPLVNCLLQNRRQSLSTPRRKSYIRALEFETPHKPLEEKRSATSPKMKPPESTQKILPSVKKTVRRSLNASKNSNVTNLSKNQGKKPNVNKKICDITDKEQNNISDNAPVATLTPIKQKLSSVWDAMTGVSCILGNKNEPIIDENIALDQSKQTIELSVMDVIESPEKGLPWDLDLRKYISSMQFEHRNETPSTKPPKRVRKVTKKVKKKRTTEKKQKTTSPSFRRVTRSKTITISPSKMNVTSKRNTYSISHGSSSGFDDSSSADETLIQVKEGLNKNESIEMTPAKLDDPVSTTEETPFTKLLRENVTSVDIDLSMLQTPFFPNTPSLALQQDHITPMHITRATDYSSSSSYYKPELTSPASCLKEIPRETVEELQKSEEFLQDITTLSGRVLVLSPPGKTNQNKTDEINKSNSLTVENITVIQKVVNCNDSEKDSSISVTNEKVDSISVSTSPAETVVNNQNEIDNLVQENEENDRLCIQKELEMSSDTDSINPSSTKDHKSKVNQILCEGKKIFSKRMVPGKNMSFLKLQMIAQCDTKLSENIPIKDSEKTTDLNYSVTEQCEVFDIRSELELKRKHTLEELKKTVINSNTKRKKKSLEKSIKKIRALPRSSKDFSKPLVCSTPNRLKEFDKSINNSIDHPKGKKRKSANGSLDEEMLKEAKKEIPPFEDDGMFPDLSIQSRKKIHMIKNILKRDEIINYLNQSAPTSQLVLKPWLLKLFNVLFKWLRHPHKQEAVVLSEIIVNYLNLFKKINLGLVRNKVAPSNLHSLFQEYRTSGNYSSSEGSSIDSSVGAMWKSSMPKVTKKRKKSDNGINKMTDEKKEEVSLPLKKRKNATDGKRDMAQSEEDEQVTSLAEVNNVSHAQSILQDIDVDRFLSRIHGQENG